jgi:hypothetical protein
VREFAIEQRLIDVVLGMIDLPPAKEDPPIMAEIPAGSLLGRHYPDLTQLGGEFSKPELLMEKRDLTWEMDEFLQKVGSIAPTLLLVEMKNGTECGGITGVPWPPVCNDAKDPSKVSCIFSLGATPTRFSLVRPDDQAIRSRSDGFGFGTCGEYDLAILDDGSCYSQGEKCYAGPRGWGALIGTSPSYFGPYARWELWRL